MRGNLPGPEGLATHFAGAQPLYLAVPAVLCAGASAALHGLPVVTTTGKPRALHSLPRTDPMLWAEPNCIARIYGLANAAHAKYSDRLPARGPPIRPVTITSAAARRHPRRRRCLLLKASTAG